MNHPVIAVALSGGVDSLVSGFLLKQKYKHVFGIHFVTGYEHPPADIDTLKKQLDLPIYVIDLSKQFEQKVVQYLVQTYLSGKTPNPCLICNRDVKFGELLNAAKSLGADYLATGHYAVVVNSISFPGKTIPHAFLEKGKDPVKDQSYFLSLLSEQQLNNIIFPLAGMLKQDVKALAKSVGIEPVQSKESQDICFIRNRHLSDFILEKQHQKPESGPIVDMTGKTVGRHQGLHQFTIGQRRGINCPASEPYYVKKIDISANRLIVCFKKDLSTSTLDVEQINWNDLRQGKIENIVTKIRYAHKGARSTLILNGPVPNHTDSGHADTANPEGIVMFDTPQNAVTPGQGAVFYDENRVLGAGIIK